MSHHLLFLVIRKGNEGRKQKQNTFNVRDEQNKNFEFQEYENVHNVFHRNLKRVPFLCKHSLSHYPFIWCIYHAPLPPPHKFIIGILLVGCFRINCVICSDEWDYMLPVKHFHVLDSSFDGTFPWNCYLLGLNFCVSKIPGKL